MQPAKKTTSNEQPAPSGKSILSPAARKAWVIRHVNEPQQAMPSERLKARADLVRKATGCGGGGTY